MDQATADRVGRQAARRFGVAPRDQIRRLSHACPAGPGHGSAADPNGARLDAPIPGDCLGGIVTPGDAGLSRWGAVRDPTRQHHLIQPDPERIGYG